MSLEPLIPLTVVVPLAVAAAMLAIAHLLPRQIPDAIAVATALFVAVLCAALALETYRHGPMVYWFGGWTPRPGVTLGIGFGVGPASAAIAAFVGLLFAATFVFGWGFFDETHAHFQVLMLLFMAAMTGFALTRDLFNLFVWFEVMSVAAFSLTAYRLETPNLAGALNFTVANSLAAILMLGGIGLIYSRAGALDFVALGRAVAARGHDPVMIGAFSLLACALMIKGAIVPFHAWLADAHAVAPSPVSVIFSGAMVSIALFALAKIALIVFRVSADAHVLLHGLFMILGAVTAVLGGLMAWAQRHLKRMLAFSTISHLGIMLTGLAALSTTGIAGLLVYFVGHGLVKGALFMVVGILLATRASLDELGLKGLGKTGIWPAGIAMGLGGLLLAGLPYGILDTGTNLVHWAGVHQSGLWVAAPVMIGSALTGAAVLRATGRIFLDLGPDPGDEANAPTQEEQEKANRPLWLMLAPCVLLLALALMPAHLARPFVQRAVELLAPGVAATSPGGRLGAASDAFSWASVALALAIAALNLFKANLPKVFTGASDSVTKPLFKGLEAIHSGRIGDYVAYIVLGMAAFSAALAFG
jgi:multicomponent Na+:H+ antiporter subunit D